MTTLVVCTDNQCNGDGLNRVGPILFVDTDHLLGDNSKAHYHKMRSNSLFNLMFHRDPIMDTLSLSIARLVALRQY